MYQLVKILVMIGSSASIGFGIWHFFVPKAWKWYSYIESNATELVAAVRAINVFFSLSLVLFGLINILLVYGDRSNKFSISCCSCCNLRFVANEGIISDYLPARFTVSGSPIRDVSRIYYYFFVLHIFALYCGFVKVDIMESLISLHNKIHDFNGIGIKAFVFIYSTPE